MRVEKGTEGSEEKGNCGSIDSNVQDHSRSGYESIERHFPMKISKCVPFYVQNKNLRNFSQDHGSLEYKNSNLNGL